MKIAAVNDVFFIFYITALNYWFTWSFSRVGVGESLSILLVLLLKSFYKEMTCDIYSPKELIYQVKG